MGRAMRDTPDFLSAKLTQIRLALGFTQSELLNGLGNPRHLVQASISRFERGTAQPPLRVLLRYAQLANITTDVLIDDDVDLPEQIPSPQRCDGIRRAPQKSPVQLSGKKTKQ